MSSAKKKSKAAAAAAADDKQAVLSRFFSAAPAPPKVRQADEPALPAAASPSAHVASGNVGIKRPRAAATVASSKLREVVSIDDEEESFAAAELEDEAEAEAAEAPAKKRSRAVNAAAAAPFITSSGFTPARAARAAPPVGAAAAAASSAAAASTAATAAAAPVIPSSPFKPRLAAGQKLSLPASATEPSSDPHAHQSYVDALVARQFAVDSATDANEINSYEQRPTLATGVGTGSASPAGTAGSGFHLPAVFDLSKWSGVAGTTSSSKFTPLELQVLEVKRRHPDVLLLCEVGYKYRFFGQDAAIAAHLLDIFVHPSHHLLTASVPTYRLSIHVKRLLDAGLKVGVVRQTETAASKKAGGKASAALFTRDISELYTKATAVPELGDEGSGVMRSAVPARFIACLFEEPASSFNDLDAAAGVRCSLVAVDPTSGALCWDSFETGFLRAELDTRLAQLAPAEILVAADSAKLSTNSERALLAYAQANANNAAEGGGNGGEGVRLEKLDVKRYKFEFNDASAIVTRFFEQSTSGSAATDGVGAGKSPAQQTREVHVLGEDEDEEAGTAQNDEECKASPASALAAAAAGGSGAVSLQSLGLPKGAVVCLGVLIPYLRAFGLDGALRRVATNGAGAIRQLSTSARHMQLDGLALHNLEVIKSQEGATQGSLLWLLSHCKTAFGGRLLRQWVLQPLASRDGILARLDAIDELMSADTTWSAPLIQVLHQLPDLERGLARVQVKQCKPLEFLRLLEALNKLVIALPDTDTVRNMRAELFRQLFGRVELSQLQSRVTHFLSSLNARAVEENRPTDFFSDATLYPAIAGCKASIQGLEDELAQHLRAARRTLGPDYAKLEYLTVLKDEFLIEVKQADVAARKVPKSWMQINATKVKARFRPPEVTATLDRLQLAREELTTVSGAAWKDFLATFASHYALLRPAIDLTASLDCLLSLGVVAALPGYVRPEIVDSETAVLEVVNGRHPMIEAAGTFAGGSAFVPNDLHMCGGEEGPRFYVISGANMGGKSTYIRSMALLVILAHLGSYVPADSLRTSVFDAVLTRMGARDALARGQSTFMLEMSETQRILSVATPRSLVILDELGRGTSTSDGVAIAHATSEYILTTVKAPTLFVTHYPLLARLQDAYPALVRNFHMAYVEEAPMPSAHGTAATTVPAITFLFKAVPGPAPSSFGLNVARMAHVDERVLRRAAEVADQLRKANDARRGRREQEATAQAWELLSKLLRKPQPQAADVQETLQRMSDLRLSLPALS